MLSVEGDPEPENATVTSIDAAGADINLAVLSEVRGMAITHLHCDACELDWLPVVDVVDAAVVEDEPLIES